MCSIIASWDNNKLKDLIELNQFRGNFSHSYTELDSKNRPLSQLKSFGAYNTDIINSDIYENYKIAHVQAPTGGMIKDENRIHPVSDDLNMLWHNGLLVPKGVKYLQNKLQTQETFDTKLLFNAIEQFGFGILSEIEGLFSCLYLKHGEMFIWRSRHGKLYIDENMNISSERFDGSKCINADTIYKIHPKNKQITEVDYFKTKRFNFYIAGEF